MVEDEAMEANADEEMETEPEPEGEDLEDTIEEDNAGVSSDLSQDSIS